MHAKKKTHPKYITAPLRAQVRFRCLGVCCSDTVIGGDLNCTDAAVTLAGIAPRHGEASTKRAVTFFGWMCFLIPLGGRALHVRMAHMGVHRTCGEPNEIELPAAAKWVLSPPLSR